MAAATIIGIVGLVIAAAGTYESVQASQKAASSDKKAKATASAQNAVNQQNTIRDQVRAARVKTAQIQQASTDTGVSASSGTIGSGSALQSQTGSNAGDIAGAGLTSTALSADAQSSANARSQSQLYGQVAGAGAQTFNIFSQTPSFKKDVGSIF